MGVHQIWAAANPELGAHLRKGAETRAAAYSAAWRAVWRALASGSRRLASRIARARRRRRNQVGLSTLSDHMLRDIGLSRADIGRASRLAADAATDLTVAEFRQRDALAALTPNGNSLPGAYGRHRRPGTGTVRRREVPDARRASAG